MTCRLPPRPEYTASHASRTYFALLVGSMLVLSLSRSSTRRTRQRRPRNWHQWRGPHATGVSATANPPLEWSETKNIRWKVEIPGRGSASPVVWGDRVFVLDGRPGRASPATRSTRRAAACTPRGVHRFIVHGASTARPARRSGSAWRASRSRTKPSHTDNGTWASSSPITDGERVYAYFESFGLYAYDMNGKLLWEKDLGDKRMRNEFGEGSTPALHGNTLVVVWDHLNGDGRSSSRSTSATARSCGACRARRSTPGRRRSSSR